MTQPRDFVGVFDSGVGGVSVLRDLVRLAPHERFLYFGDNRNAPYGTKSEDEIRALAVRVAEDLVSRGAKALVVACNTATSAAARTLRERLFIPVVGMEPALKPASFAVHGGKALVLATPATLRQEKFLKLYAQYGKDAIPCPCPGLMDFVERFEMDGARLEGYLTELLAPYQTEKIDAAVLGCTHYVFLKDAIGRALPGVPLIDGNDGTARRLVSLLREANAFDETGEGWVRFETSGDENVYLPRMRRLFAAE